MMFDDNYKKFFVINENLISFFGKGGKINKYSDNFPHHYLRFNFEGPS